MVYFDRFLIGVLVSMTAVAYYATPFDVATKLWLIPLSVVGVLFPAISASFPQDRDHTAWLFRRGIVWVFLMLFPIILLLVLFAPEIMAFWLGSGFSHHSSRVMQLLLIGVLINSLAFVPMVLVQGAGRPDLSSKLHLLEAPLYFGMLWWFTTTWGITGAAIAWSLRIVIDLLCLFYLAQRLLPKARQVQQRLGPALGGLLFLLGLAFLPSTPAAKSLFFSGALTIFIATSWHLILAPQEKEWLRSNLKFWAPTRNKEVAE
jgi:O-antigen/teichoic acid export membrane protein